MRFSRISAARRCLVFLCAAAAISGCGGAADTAKYAQVSGKVTWKGEPLAGATVTFVPVDMRNSAEPSIGVTDSNGSFFLSRRQDHDGAWIGENHVAIEKRGPPKQATEGMNHPDGVGAEIPGDPEIPEKFFSPRTSDLTFSVQSGGNANADFFLFEE